MSFEYVSLCGGLSEKLLGTPECLPPIKSPLVFADRSYGDLSSRHWNPGEGPGLLAPQISLPNFLSPHMREGQGCSSSVPLLSVWMDEVSLIPLFSDLHSTLYDGSEQWWLYILVLTWMWLCRREPCLPIPQP